MIKEEHSFIISLYLPDLPVNYTKEVQDFVKNLYASGQTALQNKNQDDSDRNDKLNPFALTVATNAACIELLLWAIRDESGKLFQYFRYFNDELDPFPLTLSLILFWGHLDTQTLKNQPSGHPK